MDYEILLKQIQELTKKTKDLQDAQKKYFTAINKDSENGDLKQLAKDLAFYSDKLSSLSETNAALQELVSSFDVEAYLRDGDFTTQMLDYCQQTGVDIIGTAPNFEMFPFKVKISSADRSLTVNNKKSNCVRPRKFVDDVNKAQSKMSKSNFNADKFANELAQAYDMYLLKKGKKQGVDAPIKDIYNLLTPTSKIRSFYDVNSFAYDLSRFVEVNKRNSITLSDGRKVQIGTSHEKKVGYRILPDGKEEYLFQIRFYTEE
ncbi:MAG: hypothetical protein IJ242_15770 [Clostridia bacterium]|nr:hypothetical protein [Clostridia bacterium]